MASISPVTTNNVKTCPHGLPFGACPVCNGMGGGGGSVKKADPPKKNEMSYAQCYAIWMRMKAADRDKLEMKADNQRQAAFIQNTQKMMQNAADKLLNILNRIESSLPKSFAALFNASMGNILRPLLNIIKNLPEFMKHAGKFIQNIQREVYNAAEKLVSIFGEIKNFIQKKLSESFKKFTKKVYRILNIFGFNNEEDLGDDEKVDAEIAAFKPKDILSIKEFLIRLTRKETKTKDDNIQDE